MAMENPPFRDDFPLKPPNSRTSSATFENQPFRITSTSPKKYLSGDVLVEYTVNIRLIYGQYMVILWSIYGYYMVNDGCFQVFLTFSKKTTFEKLNNN